MRSRWRRAAMGALAAGGLLAGSRARATAATAATVWNLELARGRTARTTVSVTNRCRAAHTFQVTGDDRAPWLSFPSAASVSLPPGGTQAVEAAVDTRALDPGERRAVVTVRCLDCGSEPGCAQDRDVFDARLKVLWSDDDLRSFDQAEVFPGEVLAVLEAGGDRRALEQAAKSLSLKPERSFELRSIGCTVTRFRMTAPERGLGAVVGGLQKESAVRLAEPNFLYRVEQSTTNDPYRDRQYALGSMGVSRLEGRATGRGVTVAVLDSAVNLKHPDLAGAVSESVDFFERTRPGPSESHGTMMAGIIGARANNGVAIAGIAPEATVIAVRACGAVFPQRGHEVCPSEAVARGLDFAIADRARVISMSLAGPYDPLVSQLVERAFDPGIVLVAATGNDGIGTVLYPAAFEKVIAVTAIDREDRLFEKANRGRRVDLAAPGVDVFTLTTPQVVTSCTGTSPAAAQVSGVVALLLQLRPGLTPAQVRRLLEETARDLGPPGRDDQFGWGAVDVCRAAAKLTGDSSICR